MNYLTQYIQETQLQYNLAFSNPVSVLTHLLFTVGTTFIDGNPAVQVSFGRSISFKDYYNNCNTACDNIEFYKNRLQEFELEDFFKQAKRTNFKNLTEQDLWNKIVHDNAERIKNIYLPTADDLASYPFWQSNVSSNGLLCISKTYSNIYQFTTKTDPILLATTKLLIQVYIEFYILLINDVNYFNVYKKASEIKRLDVNLEFIKKDLNLLKEIKENLDNL
jgi:hypothetical protein